MFQEKLDAAVSAINQHNAALGDGEKPHVNPGDFVSCIKSSGGTSEDRLRRFSYEDILDCLPNHNGIKPKVLAREIADIFRGKVENVQESVAYISLKKAEKMTLQQLVETLDPEDHTNAVGERLRKISKGEPFVVFESGRKVDVTATIKLLEEIKAGYSGRQVYEVQGIHKKVFRLGELPDSYVDENPIYIGRPLRGDGTCDQLNRSWTGVSLVIRQFIRLLADGKSIDLSGKGGREKAHEILDIAIRPDAMEFLRRRFAAESVLFDELAAHGKLPLLKVPLTKSQEVVPFGRGTKVENFRN